MQYPAEVAEFQEKKIPFRPHRSSRLPLATARGQVGGHSGYVSPIDSSTEAVNPRANGGVFRWPTTRAEKEMVGFLSRPMHLECWRRRPPPKKASLYNCCAHPECQETRTADGASSG